MRYLMKHSMLFLFIVCAIVLQACGSAPKKLMKDCDRDGEFWRCSEITKHDLNHLK